MSSTNGMEMFESLLCSCMLIACQIRSALFRNAQIEASLARNVQRAADLMLDARIMIDNNHTRCAVGSTCDRRDRTSDRGLEISKRLWLL